ncbi:MAG: sodium:proton exchanger [Actinomycetota bacterium]|nr:sodium:proton exchanger [Actinomycetota bacterium]MDH5224867.1 sodium:proton exchanger [Actinomycetota bacterium]
MTTLREDLSDIHPGRAKVEIALAAALTVPAFVVRFTHPDLPHPLEAFLFGLAIVGAAFMLSWAAEVAQLDISAGLAIAILALIAVLPEYAVDFVFAKKGGESFAQTGAACLPLDGGTESPCSLALANMTGANRLLIGVGWTMVIFIAYYRLKRRNGLVKGPNRRWEGVRLDREHSIEIGYLAVATIYSLTLPLKHSITLVDAAILVAIFIAYTIRVSRAPAEEPHLVGPASYLGTFDTAPRRFTIVTIAVFAAAVILLFAERFAEALVLSGERLGVSEFLLVQWVAPLASEAPELLVAGLYAWRLNTSSGLGTLVSSKVNQWTLLVGTLPIVFAIAAGGFHGLPIDAVQREELFLTAAQSFFAVAIISNLSMSLREAVFVSVLFWSQFILGGVVPERLHGIERVAVGIVYLMLGAWVLVSDRFNLRQLARDAFRAPYDVLARERDDDAAETARRQA